MSMGWRHFVEVTFALASISGIALASDTPAAGDKEEPRCITGNPFGGKTCLESDGHTLNVADPSGKVIWRGEALPGPYFGPQCFTDIPSRIKVCVEGDGRHLKATDNKGNVLWRRDPFVDAKLNLYRTSEAPTINVIRAGNPRAPPGHSGPRVWIMFESSQFGEVDLATGEFTPEGQN
jgi:hypothetical protein